MNAGLKMVLALLGIMALSACGSMSWIEEFPEPWQVIDPGKPMDKPPRVDVVAQGTGPVVEVGDIVQVTQKTWLNKENRFIDKNDWWLWISFVLENNSAFFTPEPRLNSGLLGLRQGAALKFIDPSGNWVSAGKLRLNPLGDPATYSWRKYVQDVTDVYIPHESGYSLIEIKRVCKGKAQYRTVRLFDDSPVQRCTWAPLQCSMTREPREGWVDEAKIEAVCQDGRTAIFQFGPVASRNGKEWTGPINPYNYFTEWEKAAWKKLPTGVQLK